MKDFTPESFGELNAEDYDALHDPGTTEASIDLIETLANGGKTLELAIGTGRVAVPLAARGLEVHGVEASPLMVDQLRAKEGGADIPVLISDMSEFQLDTRFDFAFLIFNTLFNLTSQEAQVRCFQTVADHLEPGGAFLIEAFVPYVTTFTDNQRLRTRHVGMESVFLEAITHDPVEQMFNYQRVLMKPDGNQMTPLPMRYAWPAEIDLMARLAGLKREARWGSWDGKPFTGKSEMHVSLYRKPA